MNDLILDTDIGRDIDDLLALLFLLSRHDVNLRAITCTPGRTSQIELLSAILSQCRRNDIPVGMPETHDIEYKHVADHYHTLLEQHIERPDRFLKPYRSDDLLYDIIRETPEITVISIGPLTNIRRLLYRHDDVRIRRIYAMGGYIDINDGLPFPKKFRGLPYCPEHNFSGDRPAAHTLFAAPNVAGKYFVSKNITHLSVIPGYFINDLKLSKRRFDNRPLELLATVLDRYFRKASAKKFHDPLTVCAALNHSLVKYREVTMLESDRAWGARPEKGTGLYISTWFDHEAFYKMFLADFLNPASGATPC